MNLQLCSCGGVQWQCWQCTSLHCQIMLRLDQSLVSPARTCLQYYFHKKTTTIIQPRGDPQLPRHGAGSLVRAPASELCLVSISIMASHKTWHGRVFKVLHLQQQQQHNTALDFYPKFLVRVVPSGHLWQGLEHQGEDGGVSVLFVG